MLIAKGTISDEVANRLREQFERSLAESHWLPIVPAPKCPCVYCGRRDEPDRYGNCNGCGAHLPAMRAIEVTTIGDREPKYVYVPEG